MIFMRVAGFVVLGMALSSCKTERTVLAGPTVTGLDSSRKGDLNGRFGGEDPSGYQQNSTGGLNAMSEKMFGGKLGEQSKKEFNSSQKFLTREYANDKAFNTKSWKGGKEKSPRWTDKLFDTEESSQGETTFAGAGRDYQTGAAGEAGKTARTGDYNEAGKTAGTSNYLPAERGMSDGRDEPKLSSARPDQMNSREKSIHDRIANSNASASEINKFLGKP